jgi:lipoprotein-anchoring transpeptidase ErfK/SrfK
MIMRLLRVGAPIFLTVAACLSVGRVADAWSHSDQAIYIWKSRRLMVLREGGQIVRRFEVALGIDPEDPKMFRGDNRTPEGTYFIREKKTQSSFRRFLGLSYPNVTDAERGLNQSMISQEEWADIFFANMRGRTPPWTTRLGGRIGIRTVIAQLVDWTKGCIAVRNDDIEYLYERVQLGTPVHIKE